MSLPARERGSKQCPARCAAAGLESLPARERGSKQHRAGAARNRSRRSLRGSADRNPSQSGFWTVIDESLPAREHGSKQERRVEGRGRERVAPCAGARIETARTRPCPSTRRGRSLRGSADRNQSYISTISKGTRRSLRGSADRNLGENTYVIPAGRRSLRGSADRNHLVGMIG